MQRSVVVKADGAEGGEREPNGSLVERNESASIVNLVDDGHCSKCSCYCCSETKASGGSGM